MNLRADHPQIDDLLDLLIAEGVKVASFAMAPKQALIGRLKDAGVVVIPSIGAKRHAEKVAAWGVDAVLVQGGEGGGHTGSVPTTLLLPQVVDAVDIPVIAAGGFFDGRGLVAALAYGAAGIAMGTRFLLTKDCVVPDAVKAEYLEAVRHRHGRDDPGRRLAPPGAAHRAGRAAGEGQRRSRRCPGPSATPSGSRSCRARRGGRSSARAWPCARPRSSRGARW